MRKKQTVCVLGGSGFVGRHLIGELVKTGREVKVLSRKRERSRKLLVLPGVSVVTSDVYNVNELSKQLHGIDVVINLVGILNERGKQNSFRESHVELASTVLTACKNNGIKRLLHMSSLNADAKAGVSEYLKSKGEAEDAVHAASDIASKIEVTSFRPSVIFGQDDDFFNRFAGLLKLSPKFFPLACPDSKIAPVYIGDVVDCMVQSINNKQTFGQRYELCGPKTYTLKQLVEYTAQHIGSNKRILGLGNGLSSLQASLMGLLPTKPFTRDNYKSLQVDSVCEDAFPAVFNKEPTSVDEIMPGYLAMTNSRGRYFDYRTYAKR